jgi:two-component system CitB family response regulator/two-component system response regulator DcuR
MTSEGPIRVLIVEDDLRISELHRRFTTRIEGFEVVGIANTLADAEEMAEVLAPDLVLLDLFFPEGNGLELLRRLRAGAVPTDVILITAAREMTSLKEALRGGVFDYIIKPVFLPRFQEALLKYRDYAASMRSGGTLDQKEVDRLLRAHPGQQSDDAQTPKGIDPLTLRKVRQVFAVPSGTTFSAEEVAEHVGVSRSTARRYLEHLVGEGFLDADLLYGVVGRPERRYFRRA